MKRSNRARGVSSRLRNKKVKRNERQKWTRACPTEVQVTLDSF
jgi:hypothetical protein